MRRGELQHLKENDPVRYQEHLEKGREHSRLWRQNNPEKVRTYAKLWKQNNPEKYKALKTKQRDLKHTDPEKYALAQEKKKATRNKRMSEDFNYFVERSFDSLQRGAQRRNYAFNLGPKQLARIIGESPRCSVSGVPLTQKSHDPARISIDRIDNRFGYSVKNVQVVSAMVNRCRLDYSMEEFIAMCCNVAKVQGYRARGK